VPAGAETAALRSAVWTSSGGDGRLELTDGVLALTGSSGPVFRAALGDVAARPGRVHWYSGTHVALNVSGAWHQLHFRDAAAADAWRHRLAGVPKPPREDLEASIEREEVAAAARARADAEAGIVREAAWRRVGIFKKENLELRLAGNRLILSGSTGPLFDIPLSAIEAFETPWYRSGHVKVTAAGEHHVFSLTERNERLGRDVADIHPVLFVLLLPVYLVYRAVQLRGARRKRREWRALARGELDPRALAWERSRQADEKAIKAQS
jgi:hypothetical protein